MSSLHFVILVLTLVKRDSSEIKVILSKVFCLLDNIKVARFRRIRAHSFYSRSAPCFELLLTRAC